MSTLIPFGSENFFTRDNIEYIDVEIREMPPDIDVTYNSFNVAGDGRLYMGTCRIFGSAHILCYDPRKDKIEVVANMDEALNDHKRGYDKQGKIHGRLFEGKDGKLYGATHMDIATPVYGNFYSASRYPGGHWIRLDPESWKIEDLGIPKEGEGILTNTMDVENNILYGITWPSGYLYSYDIDSGISRNLGRTSIHLSRFILCMSDGTLFYAMKDGFIGRYRKGEDCIRSLPNKIPLRLSAHDWLWRKGALQCAIEWEKGKSFVAFAGNPIMVSREDDDTYSVKHYPFFKNGIYSCFELVKAKDNKIYYSNHEYGEPFSHSGRLFRFDPESGLNELVGYMRCGELHDFRHIAGGAISPDGNSLYYSALVPRNMVDRIDLTAEIISYENALYAKGELDDIWLRKHFKPVLVICRLNNK